VKDLSSDLKEIFISVVVLHKHVSADSAITELITLLSNNYSDYEVIIVSTHQDQNNLQNIQQTPGLRYLKLVGEVDDELAFAAGLENAIGDIVITTNLTSTPLNLINESIEKIDIDTPVILGKNSKPSPAFYQLSHKLFNIISTYTLGVKIPSGLTHFKAISRGALNIALSRKKLLSQLNLSIIQNASHYSYINYREDSQKSYISGLQKVLKLLVFNSTKLLRIFNLLGLGGGMMAFLISLYVFMVNLFKQEVMEGWTSLSLFISVQFCILFLVLFIYGEYMARLVDERWMSKEYDILFEKRGPTSTERLKWNVKSDS
jgi:hypothetical protein